MRIFFLLVLCGLFGLPHILFGQVTELTDSWVKQREELNTKLLKSYDIDRLLHNFRVNAGIPSDAQPLEGWEAPKCGLRGHFTGHYLSAISHLVGRYQDSELVQRLNVMVQALYECQQALDNGYLSAFPSTEFDKLEQGNYAVWAPYYTYQKIMQGLLDAYLYAGNEQAYQIVQGMADYVESRLTKLDDNTIEKMLYSVGANPANEAGAMNEVLWRLYRVSQNPKHKKLAQIFDRDWFAVPLAENRNVLNGLHANTHIALVTGFAQRYNATQESKYRDAVCNFWHMLTTQHAYANGTNSGPRPNVTTATSLTAEHWGVPGVLSNTLTKGIAESCVTHNTQELAAELFAWTKDAQYADSYMNTFYNGVMALHSAHSGSCTYHLPLGSPRKKEFLNNTSFMCCNGSTVEAFASLDNGIYFQEDNDLWVKLYVPSKYHWSEKKVVLEQTGNFPSEMEVEFTVNAKKKSVFDLHFFIPSWSHTAKIYVNGVQQSLQIFPESFATLSRQWADGDRIRLVFHADFHYRSMPDDSNVIALFYGPLMLAFESDSEVILKGSPADILKGISKAADGTFTLQNNGQYYKLRPFFQIEDESYGVYATIRDF